MTATWIQRLVETRDDAAIAVVRIALGLVMFPHAAQKMFGWFGGAGFSGTVEFFSTMGLPAPLAVLVILGEFLGSIALITGAFSRLGGLAIGVIMLGAIALVHWPHGFFMNWFGTQTGEGFEYHILALAMAVAVMVRGGGSLSVDRLLMDVSVHGRTAREAQEETPRTEHTHA